MWLAFLKRTLCLVPPQPPGPLGLDESFTDKSDANDNILYAGGHWQRALRKAGSSTGRAPWGMIALHLGTHTSGPTNSEAA